MKPLLLIVASLLSINSFSQYTRDNIVSDFVLYERRVAFDKHMREKTINTVFAQPLNADTEDKYLEACLAISQFLLRSPEIEKGFRTLFGQYATLDFTTKRAFLEAVYGVYPSAYKDDIKRLVQVETIPKLFAMQAVYLYRLDATDTNKDFLRGLLNPKMMADTGNAILQELDKYLAQHQQLVVQPTPDTQALFLYQKQTGQKTIYSFQRWNRDHPGLAVIQHADGNFVRDSSGKLLVFRQLARSASDLPYFITNGSTPQGIYSIQGTAVSHNKMIGPTPNIQLVMPNEADSVFWHTPYDSAQTPLANYLHLLPPQWRTHTPMTEAFFAGRIGRTEIIAHGTTIDPTYFKDKPFYPLTPTMGCLCAAENWNIFNGKFIESDQFRLADAFLSNPGNTGYLVVINLDNQQKAITKEEIEKLVSSYITATNK